MLKIARNLFITAALIVLFALNGASEEINSGKVLTADNVDIAYEHYKNGNDSVIIVCPGFYNSKKNRWMKKAIDMLSPVYDVIIFDFRGHGGSGGKFTWSDKEYMDVNAVLDYADGCGYKHIGILAFSLGAASAINAAPGRNDIDSMVLVSPISRFSAIDFHFWEPGMFLDLKDNIDCKWEGKGARTGSIFLLKKDPIRSIDKIKNIPILFIHGDKDWIIKDRHSKKLYDAAVSYKKIEIIKDGFHAERLIQFQYDIMQKLIFGWFEETLAASPVLLLKKINDK